MRKGVCRRNTELEASQRLCDGMDHDGPRLSSKFNLPAVAKALPCRDHPRFPCETTCAGACGLRIGTCGSPPLEETRIVKQREGKPTVLGTLLGDWVTENKNWL